MDSNSSSKSPNSDSRWLSSQLVKEQTSLPERRSKYREIYLSNLQEQPDLILSDAAGDELDGKEHDKGPFISFDQRPPPTPSEKYRYQPLKTPTSTRMLRIPSISEGDQENFDIVSVDLEDGLTYDALSYTWGSLKSLTAIRLGDDKCLLVTITLYLAIQHMRPKNGYRLVWVDQISINQDDLEERSVQVRQMHRIYRNARFTFVWLGEYSFDGKISALDVIDLFNMAIEAKDVESAFNNQNSKYYIPLEGWAALAGVINRTWFHRLWVFQEIVLAKRPWMMLGGFKYPWSYLQNAVNGFLGMPMAFQELGGLPARGIKLMKQIQETKDEINRQLVPSLSHLLHELGGRQECTEPRDFVYALMNVSVESLPKELIDYSLSIEHIYTKCAKILIEKERSLELLFAAGGLKKSQWPSWVPDWSRDRPMPLTYPRHYACNARPYAPVASTRITELVVSGKMVDEITHVIDHCFTAEDSARSDPIILLSLPSLFVQILPLLFETPSLDVGDGASVFEFIRKLIRTVLRGDRNYSSDWKSIDPLSDNSYRIIWNLCLGPDEELQALQFPLEGMSMEEIPKIWWHSFLLFQSGILVDRKLAVTKNKTVGLVPPSAQPGDAICIIHGSRAPWVIHKNLGEIKFLGHCYVDGIMYGEAVDWSEDEAETFTVT